MQQRRHVTFRIDETRSQRFVCTNCSVWIGCLQSKHILAERTPTSNRTNKRAIWNSLLCVILVFIFYLIDVLQFTPHLSVAVTRCLLRRRRWKWEGERAQIVICFIFIRGRLSSHRALSILTIQKQIECVWMCRVFVSTVAFRLANDWPKPSAPPTMYLCKRNRLTWDVCAASRMCRVCFALLSMQCTLHTLNGLWWCCIFCAVAVTPSPYLRSVRLVGWRSSTTC